MRFGHARARNKGRCTNKYVAEFAWRRSFEEFAPDIVRELAGGVGRMIFDSDDRDLPAKQCGCHGFAGNPEAEHDDGLAVAQRCSGRCRGHAVIPCAIESQ